MRDGQRSFHESCEHYINQLNWLIGPEANVQAMTGTLGGT